jgi:hypothetical protein
MTTEDFKDMVIALMIAAAILGAAQISGMLLPQPAPIPCTVNGVNG